MSAQSANRFIRKRGDRKVPDFTELAKKTVSVGLPDDVIHNPSGMTMAEIGTIHEFGSTDGRVPARSFLRSWVVTKKSNITNNLKASAKRFTKGSSVETEHERLALYAENGVKEQIVNVTEPGLADSTLRRKKGAAKTTRVDEDLLIEQGEDTLNNPLIDTGEMRKGVIGLVVDND